MVQMGAGKRLGTVLLASTLGVVSLGLPSCSDSPGAGVDGSTGDEMGARSTGGVANDEGERDDASEDHSSELDEPSVEVDDAAAGDRDGAHEVSGEDASPDSKDDSRGPLLPIECDFLDVALEAAVREANGLEQGPITSDATTGLNELDAPKSGIASLDGIECLRDLTVLRLYDNPIDDISPLAALPDLTIIDVAKPSDTTHPRITSIDAVLELPKLTSLNLAGNAISDISALERHSDLRTLILSSNELTELAALANLQLTTLAVENNQLTDLSPLEGLPLRTLYVSANQIDDISPIATLQQLEILFLQLNPISNLSPLAALPALRTLLVNGTVLDSIEPLATVTSLSVLAIINSGVTDLSPLESLDNLENVTLSDNLIEDVSSLVGLPALQDIDLRGNPLDCDGQQSNLEQLLMVSESNDGAFEHDCAR